MYDLHNSLIYFFLKFTNVYIIILYSELSDSSSNLCNIVNKLLSYLLRMVFSVIHMFNLLYIIICISWFLANGNNSNIFFCKIGNPQNLFGKIYKSTENEKGRKLQLMSINETIVVSKNESFPLYFAFL